MTEGGEAGVSWRIAPRLRNGIALQGDTPSPGFRGALRHACAMRRISPLYGTTIQFRPSDFALYMP
jgi:hypothetical protein